MARQLALAVVLVVAGSPLVACTATDDDDWYPCGEGPDTEMISFVSFSAADLTCTRTEGLLTHSSACVHSPPQGNIMTRPIACDGPCVTLDETACASNAQCFVARDFTAFYTGAPAGFLGCFPKTPFVSRAGCEERNATTCAFDGSCAGLYDRAPPPHVRRMHRRHGDRRLVHRGGDVHGATTDVPGRSHTRRRGGLLHGRLHPERSLRAVTARIASLLPVCGGETRKRPRRRLALCGRCRIGHCSSRLAMRRRAADGRA